MRSVFITQKGLTHNLFVLSSQTNKLVNMCVSRFGPKDDLAVFNYSLKRRTLLQQSRAEPASVDNRWEVKMFPTQTSLDHKDIDAVIQSQ